MKQLIFIISTLIFISACSTTREMRSSGVDLRNEKKLAEQARVKEAVESGRFIIKLDRLYFSRGGIVDLVPRSNYIIVDGKTARISAAYLGRQFTFRPIAGINMKGKTTEYKLISDPAKGKYQIEMKVNQGGDFFNVYLTIGNNGSCSASLSSIKIETVRYSGQLVPIKEKKVSAKDKMYTL